MMNEQKKVAILSMQRIFNNGSFLQAYGLKKLIEGLGHEVVFMDYKLEAPICSTPQEKKKYRKLKYRNIFLNVIYKLKFLHPIAPDELKYYFQGRRQYEKALKNYLNITNKRHFREKVDTLVIGSDEVFNCFQLNPYVGYSKELFGFNAKAEKKITYAASFGNVTIDKIISKGKQQELSKMLSEFDSISVRDNNSFEIVRSLIPEKEKIGINLDPVLIYDFAKEINEEVEEKDYIIVYAYRKRLNQEEITAIVDFAKKHNKKIISIGGYHSFSDIRFQGNPLKVLAYFKNADYIFTDTFHGTIFSIIFHKRFATFIRSSEKTDYGNNEKLSDLLDRLHLSARSINDCGLIDEIMDTEIAYAQVDKIIEEERKKSIEYLAENL